MELFSVNRYTEGAELAPRRQEEEILQKLLQKVEKRKNTQINSNNEIGPVAVADEDGGKRRRTSVSESAERESDEINSDPEEVETLSAPPADDKQPNDFQILGESAAGNGRHRVDVVLPAWLEHPTVISTNISTNSDGSEYKLISNVDFLEPYIRDSLDKMGIKRLFPVQEAVIPWILNAHAKPPPFRPRDVCVSAPTGSGKTLAFAIPIVQLLASRVERKVRALVVLPVAELAVQIFKVFKKLCEKTDLTVCLLSTQTAFRTEQEKLVEHYKNAYYSKVDIVVTTPGRLVDHIHATKGFCLKSLRFLVIDEADRIMDAMFQNWLYHLDSHVRATSDQLLSGRAAPLCFNELELMASSQPHKLLFSATLSQDPEKLQSLRLFQPKLFTSVLEDLGELREKYTVAANASQTQKNRDFIGKYTTPNELTEKYCITESRLKPLTLFSLIKDHNWTKFLCFTNSIESSGRLAFVLKRLFKDSLIIAELSASISAKERANILSSFSRGKINGVICSDALARGIDVPDVDIVISYDPPRHIKTYIHRIGRTARAGRQGTAITLLTHKELATFNQILAGVGKVLNVEITASTATEEANAKAYSLALRALHSKITSDKRLRLLQKERAKEKTLVHHKDSSKISLMEKLQIEASTQVFEKPEQEVPFLSTKRNRKNRKPSHRKK